MSSAIALPPTGPADAAHPIDDPVEWMRFSHTSAARDGQRRVTSAWQVSGLSCAACCGPVELALMGVDGVESAQVSAATGRAQVRWDPARTRPSALLAAIRAAGHDAVPDAAAPAREFRRHEQRLMVWRLFVAGFCAMQVMMLATPGYVAPPGDLAPDLRQLLNWGGWVLTLPVLVFSAAPFFQEAWQSCRQRRIGMALPVSIGLLVAFVASTVATFSPGGALGHEVYYDSVTMFVAFLLGARVLELRARHRAQAALEASLAAMPRTAWREMADGQVERVGLHRLRPGDIVRVPLGEAFPADGRLLEGVTHADESLLTGESAPVPKAVGDDLVGGAVNVGAPVRMTVDAVGADTRHEAIVAMMREAMTQRPDAARVADRWATPFLWVVLLLAAGSAAAWSVVDPSRAVAVAVAVLIVTCPCALSLATPSTLVAAAGGLARRGVQVRRLEAIVRFAQVERLFTDKTGTLTDDRLQVRAMHVAPQAGPWIDTLRRHAASLARWSGHPVAQAVAALDGGDAAAAPAMHDVRETPGDGLVGIDAEGRHWRLARRDAACDLAWADGAGTLLWLDDVPMAAFECVEHLRPNVVEALQALREDGIRLTLLSGDQAARVDALASRLGVADVVAQATPADKLAAVAAAQRDGRCIAMVGDGVNDGPVLARADVSLAMGQGALVARAQADAVVVSGDWGDIVRLRHTAQRTVRIVRQNLAWAALYNAACVPMAMAGWLPPWAAGLGMALSSLLVVGNATRASKASSWTSSTC